MYKRAKLVDDARQPIRLAALHVGATVRLRLSLLLDACFLLRLETATAGGIPLKTETGFDYTWEGGVGSGRKRGRVLGDLRAQDDVSTRSR
jgi:hypothetical protein